MALTLLRHGPVPAAFTHRYNGWSDVPLDKDAFLCVAKTHPLRRVRFDAVVSSDLRRCRETLEVLDLAPYRIDVDLREVRFKAHIEGKSFDEIRKLSDFDEVYLSDEELWHTYLCAESIQVFRRRVKRLLQRYDFQTNEILWCTHAGVVREVYKQLDMPYAHYLDYGEFIRMDGGI